MYKFMYFCLSILKTNYTYYFSAHFKEVIKRAHQEPVKKYSRPQTEAQEVGWITKPLVCNTFFLF